MNLLALKGLARLAGVVAGPLLIAGAGAAAAELWEHHSPWGFNARLTAQAAQLKAREASLAEANRRGIGWTAAYRQSEALRLAEAAAGRTAVNSLPAACAARIADVRRSALAIQSLVNKEPARDPNGCPTRELVDPRVLRDAVAPSRRR